ncbi:MAG: hypothetical protein II234_00045 [Clostridia bacterium]|nr:hypothetical protein [Clostridia bacterium]
MTTIGAAWIKTSENGEKYTSISFDKAILPLQITDDKRFALKTNKNKSGESSSDYYLECYIPDQSKIKK